MQMETTNRNFDGLADSVVDKFFAKDSPTLDNIIVSEAKSSELNPNEIKRLVEKSNLMTMLRFLQTSEDKRVEFDMADYDKVLPMVYSGNASLDAKDAKLTLSDSINSLDPLDSLDSAIPDIRKQASLHTIDGVDVLQAFLAQNITMKKEASQPIPQTKHIRVNEIFKMEKCAAELRKIKVQKELNLNNIMDKLATDFCTMNGPDFSKFAQEAYYIHGKSSTALLHNLAKVMREEVTFTKQAEQVNQADEVNVIDNTSDQHLQFNEAQEELMSYIKVATQLEKMQEHITAKWDVVKDLADGKGTHV